MDLKKPLTFSEQVQRLIDHGMIVNDTKVVEEFLSKVNYYRFTGYAIQFRKSDKDSDFKQPILFEDIVKLYEFDKELRNILRKYIEIIELFYRTQISYCFAVKKCMLPPHNQHYDKNNFNNKKVYNDVKSSFGQKRQYYINTPIMKHHISRYGNKLPLWVITEMMSFSDLTKLYTCMTNDIKDDIAKNNNTGRTTLKNHLICIKNLRNKCAHSCRLYNETFNPGAKLGKRFLIKHPEVRNNSLFSQLLVITKQLPIDSQKSDFITEINNLLEKYIKHIDMSLIGFPPNYKDIFNKIKN